MNILKIIAVEGEIYRLSKAIAELKKDESAIKHISYGFGCKKTATVKRLSMELTNALVELRKPQ